MKNIIYILLIICNLNLIFAQSGKVEGKLLLEDENEYELVARKTIVSIEYDDGLIFQSAVDDNLKFSFENLPKGRIRITLNPRAPGKPISRYEKVKNNKTLNLHIEYSLSCEYDKSIDSKVCPICQKEDKVIPIVYGLVMKEALFVDKDGNIFDKDGKPFDKNKKRNYFAGGCLVTDCDPNWYCERDKNQF